jgi:methylenetetrahydrofolate dehydrogenase (NADP+)/methenyltetrahydrofolate cyclohydrolase
VGKAFHLPENVTESHLLKVIDQLNQDQSVDAILVQLPLPQHLNTRRIIEQILPEKDVDGFHPYNLGKLAQNQPLLRPCTSLGVMKLLHFYQLPLVGMHAVIVGASNIVGKPMAYECLNAGATITQCHRETRNLAKHIQAADIVISAVGEANLIQAQWLKPGAIVVDIGFNRLPSGQLAGDVEFENARKIASWITPVPGGVGPMTVVCLCMNTLQARYLQTRNKYAASKMNEDIAL